MDLRMDDLSNSTPRLRKIKEEELIPDSDHRLLPKPSAISPMSLFSSRIMSTRSIKPTSSAHQAKQHDHANKHIGEGKGDSDSSSSKTRRVSKSRAAETPSGSLEILTTEATRRSSRRISSTSMRSEVVKGNADESITPLSRSRRMLLSSQSELNTTMPLTSSNLGLNESSMDASIFPGIYGGKPAQVPKSGSDLSAPVNGKVLSGCSPVDEEATTQKSMLKSTIPITLMPITSSCKNLEGDDLESSRILCRQYSFMSDITMDYSLSTVLQSMTSRSKLMLSSTSVSSVKDSHLVDKAGTHRPPPSASATYVVDERSHDRSFRSTDTIARTKNERRKSKSTNRTCKSLTSEEQTSKTNPATDPEHNSFSYRGSKIPPELLSVGKLHPKKGEELSSLKRTTDPVVNTFDALKTAFPPDIIRQQLSQV